MQVIAKLIQINPIQTGVSRNGEWKKQEIIVETNERFPKKLCIVIWGDKVHPSQLKPGNLFTIEFDIESREFNGRWYTDIKASKIEPFGAVNDKGAAPPDIHDYQFPEPPPPPPDEQEDLPF